MVGWTGAASGRRESVKGFSVGRVGRRLMPTSTHPSRPRARNRQRRVSRRGFASRSLSPFQARLTTCAATSDFFGRRAPSHH